MNREICPICGKRAHKEVGNASSKEVGKFVARNVVKHGADISSFGVSSLFESATNYGLGKITNKIFDKCVPDTYQYYCSECDLEWTDSSNMREVINNYFDEKSSSLWGHFGLAILPVILAYVLPLMLVPILMVTTFSFPDYYWDWYVGYFEWSWMYVFGYAALVIIITVLCSYSNDKEQQKCLRRIGCSSSINTTTDTLLGCLYAVVLILAIGGAFWWFKSCV